ncbi:MAG: hypothetical protein Q8O74_08285, partial [bacterium]|nr:hypothetical protein [bacterium]
MKQVALMTMGELGAYVSSHLASRGIKVVLSGGACVSIYSANLYRSDDLDFIESGNATRKQLKQALEEIGFKENHRYFQHQETKYFLEFPPGPLAVGREPVKEVVQKRYSTGTLRLISPTDCVKDRLAAYFHWRDLQSLEQALLVCSRNPVNLREIKRWAKSEGMAAEYAKNSRRFQLLQER